MIDHTHIKGDKEATTSETLGSRVIFFMLMCFLLVKLMYDWNILLGT